MIQSGIIFYIRRGDMVKRAKRQDKSVMAFTRYLLEVKDRHGKNIISGKARRRLKLWHSQLRRKGGINYLDVQQAIMR